MSAVSNMEIQQFRYSNDNMAYLVYSGREGIVIDGGAVDDILGFVEKNNIAIKIISNTHSHYDHVPGNKPLLKATGADFLDCKTIISDKSISLGSEIINVFPTPGHSSDDVCFQGDEFLITGDTLFNGTIGNCFSGNLKAFFNSLKRLISFPGTFKVYAGHDYVKESMTYARIIEKYNFCIDDYEKKYSPDLVVSTLEDELKVNPYLRFNDPDMIANLKERGITANTEFSRFEAIMELY